MPRKNIDHMPDAAFRMMNAVMVLEDAISPRIDRRVQSFGIQNGMTIVDYGCGPGRYATRFSALVGEKGRVYAVDVHELAIESVKRKMQRLNLTNIMPVLANGYDTGLSKGIADMVCAIDMFFGVQEPTAFLREVHRIAKPAGRLLLDDGHQARSITLQKIAASPYWKVLEETRDHILCIPTQAETA